MKWVRNGRLQCNVTLYLCGHAYVNGADGAWRTCSLSRTLQGWRRHNGVRFVAWTLRWPPWETRSAAFIREAEEPRHPRPVISLRRLSRAKNIPGGIVKKSDLSPLRLFPRERRGPDQGSAHLARTWPIRAAIVRGRQTPDGRGLTYKPKYAYSSLRPPPYICCGSSGRRKAPSGLSRCQVPRGTRGLSSASLDFPTQPNSRCVNYTRTQQTKTPYKKINYYIFPKIKTSV